MNHYDDIEPGTYESINDVSEDVSVQAAEESSEAHESENLAEPSRTHEPEPRGGPSGANESQNISSHKAVSYSSRRQVRSVIANMAEFAIASLAHMASQNPLSASFNGNLTHLGQKIDVHWQSAIPLLAAIVAGHVALFSAAVYVSRSVIIKDDSLLAIARLLRPLVDTLGDTGTAMSGKELSDEISKSRQYEKGVLYGPNTRTGAEVYHLDLAGDGRPLDGWYEGRHPDGVYS